MTKAALIDEVAKVLNLTKKETAVAIDTIFETIADALARGQKLELRGFGSFRVRHRRSKRGRNPKTGSGVNVPAKRVPFFRMGRHLRQFLKRAAPVPVGDPAGTARDVRAVEEAVP
ncbi:MAG: integration host factor subunit beta [Candidatus Rokubacteria bacterium]|nr:integration host factor subunit beta [Candidatus Rokubacteria bacterium]